MWCCFALLASFCCLLLFNCVPSTSEQDLDDTIYSNDFGSHSDIKTKWHIIDRNSFPIEKASYSTSQLSPSKLVWQLPFFTPTTILISLRNLGQHTFNITKIHGFLHASHMHSFHVQNYTEKGIMDGILHPRNEMTFEYQFTPWEGLTIVDYVLSADIHYKLLSIDSQSTITIEDNQRSNDDEYEDEDIDDEIAFQASLKKKTAVNEQLLEIEFCHKFLNVTITVFNSNESYILWIIDFEFFFMLFQMSIALICFGLAFYELYYYPNEIAQGKQPLTTYEFVIDCYLKIKVKFMQMFSFGDRNDDIKGGVKARNGNIDRNARKIAEKNDWLRGSNVLPRKNKSKTKGNRK